MAGIPEGQYLPIYSMYKRPPNRSESWQSIVAENSVSLSQSFHPWAVFAKWIDRHTGGTKEAAVRLPNDVAQICARARFWLKLSDATITEWTRSPLQTRFRVNDQIVYVDAVTRAQSPQLSVQSTRFTHAPSPDNSHSVGT